MDGWMERLCGRGEDGEENAGAGAGAVGDEWEVLEVLEMWEKQMKQMRRGCRREMERQTRTDDNATAATRESQIQDKAMRIRALRLKQR